MVQMLSLSRSNKRNPGVPRISDNQKQDGYLNIATNVPLFHEMGRLPIYLDPCRLDERNGIHATLINNSAKYHQKCRLKFNNTKLQRAQKRSGNRTESAEDNYESRQKIPRRSPIPSECFLCEECSNESQMRQVMTKQLNDKVTECALALSDWKLLTKVNDGDPVAKKMRYHPACLTTLYNRKRAYLNSTYQGNQSSEHADSKDVHSLAFSELVVYITETINACTGQSTIFKLADLTRLYNDRVQQQGVASIYGQTYFINV